MKFINFLLKFKLTRRLIDSIVKNFFLARKINTIYLKYRDILLELNMEDSYDRVFIFKGYWENNQIDYLIDQSFKNKSQIFIDIGSNSGLYSLSFAKKNNFIQIYSYEPINKTYQKQIRNINLNNLKNKIEIYNYGLSNINQETFFKTKTSYNYKQSSTYKIDTFGDEKGVVKIFDQFKKIMDKNIIIKIDVEGHEKEVLMGMKNTILKNRTLIQVEIFDENYEKVNNFLTKNGFFPLMKIDSDHFYKNYD